MAIEHWMTFATFSEQDFFTYPDINSYFGVIINANMVAHAPAGIAAFLLEKIPPGVAFLIDPMTHAFQHNPETISGGNGGPKSSIRNLAIEYSGPIVRNLGVRPLQPGEVLENLRGITRRVLEFQWNYLEQHFGGNENAKYLEKDEVVRRPSVLVAPYFYITEDNIDEWLGPVAKCAESAVDMGGEFPGAKIYSAVVVHRAILQSKSLVGRLHDALGKIGLHGLLMWVDEFDEAGASNLELKGFLELCAGFRAKGLELINLHGGYFSCLAANRALGGHLTGVSHGPEFGEARGVVPVGGGIPISRFYVPDLHIRMKFRDFLPIAIKSGWLASPEVFHREVCGCRECVEVLSGNVENFQLYGESEVKSIKRKHGVVRIEFPTTEAKKRCLKHYLCRKSVEFRASDSSDGRVLLDGLARSHAKFAEFESSQSISHLIRWKRALEGALT